MGNNSIIKEKEKEKDMIKTNLENIVKELEEAIEENNGLMFGLAQQLENNFENETLQREDIKLDTQHRKLYDILISVKKLLKGMEY